jgi:hypothetical protein
MRFKSSEDFRLWLVEVGRHPMAFYVFFMGLYALSEPRGVR